MHETDSRRAASLESISPDLVLFSTDNFEDDLSSRTAFRAVFAIKKNLGAGGGAEVAPEKAGASTAHIDHLIISTISNLRLKRYSVQP